MTDHDELLLEQFFQQARNTQLPDAGFTRRVMSRLPERSLRLSRLWTAFCLVLIALLFFLGGAWKLLLADVLAYFHTATMPAILVQAILCAAAFTALAAAEVLRRERRSLQF